jgi:protocatechuate 4,5-dioxygenase alpha chain
MNGQSDERRPRIIIGTPVFDGGAATRGYALNAMCFSFNDAANRAAFVADEDGYCRSFGLDEEQRRAVAERDVSAMIACGGNVYYLAKLAGIFGQGVQDIGAQQTGMSVEAFRDMLAARAWGEEIWETSLAASSRATFLRSATRSLKGGRTIPIGSRSSTDSCRCGAG